MSNTFDQVMWVLVVVAGVVELGYVVVVLAGPVRRMIRRWVVYARLLVTYLRAFRALGQLAMASWRHTRAMLLAADRQPEPRRPVARGGGQGA
jgi:hypothetical protein